jgi:hypothetical protein
MTVLHHSLCVCVCVKTRRCVEYVQRLVAVPVSALKSACPGTRVVQISCHYRAECVRVSTPEVTSRSYPSLPALQQMATCAVIGSHITQPVILGLQMTLSVVLIGVE